MDVSVIIINYNTISLTIQCIQSILQHTTGIKYEIIIVDNNSEDDIQTEISRHFSNTPCEIICKKLNENVGFGRGNNEGFKISKGRNVFCLNPDTILLNNAIKILSDYIDTHAETGACGGNLFSKDMQPNLSFRRYLPGVEWELHFLTFMKFDKLIYGNNTIFNNSSKPLNVGYISGADLMMRRRDVEKVKGFSPEYFMYFEETDLCYKIKQQGYKITSVPEAHIIHLEGGSFKDNGTMNTNAIDRSEFGRLTYYKKNKSALSVFFINKIYSIALSLNKHYFRSRHNKIWRYYEYRQESYKKALAKTRH